jgi:hypothetical protein
MRKRNRGSSFMLPIVMARLTVASMETIMHRTRMMALGTCSAAEYQRMVLEKADAARQAMQKCMMGYSPTAILAPYLTRARSNAKRLRRKR